MGITTCLCDSDNLVVAVTGISNKLNLPTDDFFKEAGLSGTSRIVIKDSSKRLTLGGLAPEFPTFFDLLAHLKKEITHISPQKVIVTGTSGGGYTALLLGHLLKADYVVCFNPYTYLSIKQAKKMDDTSLQQIHRKKGFLSRAPKEIMQFLDLKEPLSKWNGKTRYYIHASRYNNWDYRHALYLKSTKKVSVIFHPYSVHSIVQPMVREQKLKRCFLFPYRRTLRLKDMIIYTKKTMKRALNLA